MKTLRIIALLLILGSALFLFAFTRPNAPSLVVDAFASTTPEREQPSRLVFSVPLSSGLITYQGFMPEQRPWGPSSLRLDDAGVFWIADAAGSTIVGWNEQGTLIGSVAMPETIVNVTDFFIDGGEFVVLDASAVIPTVFRISRDGSVVESQLLPQYVEGSVSGMREIEGDVVVGLENDSYLVPLRAFARESGLESLKRHAMKVPIRQQTGAGSEIRFGVGAGRARAYDTLSADLGGAVYAGASARGDIFALLETATGESVDQTVRRYDASARKTGVARIPLSEQFVYVAHPLAISPSGEAYFLLTKQDRVEVRELVFSQTLSSLPATRIHAEPSVVGIANESTSCISRSTILSNASRFTSNLIYLTTTNVSGACSGRSKPRYLSVASTYPSVSYDWGGYDSPDLFNYAMRYSSYNKAGDINTSTESCSRGVDCSGFISRVWRLGSKYSTYSLQNVSTRLSSRSSLLAGDILNYPGVHTALIAGTCSGGYSIYESTTSNGYDRVVRVCRSASYFGSSYQPRRYARVCG